MERFHLSIFSSKAILRDLLIGAALVLGMECYFAITMRVFEPQEKGLSQPGKNVLSTTASTNYIELGQSDSTSFFRSIAGRVIGPALVFVGDSQGMGPRKGKGESYPEVVAGACMRSMSAGTVISLHLGGSNTYEQGVLLLSLIKAGIDLRVVVWANSLFSHRRNEIRSELVTTFSALGDEITQFRPNLILLGGSAVRSSSSILWGGKAADAWAKIVNRSAIVRFSRQPLYEKYIILRHSPLVRLIPTSWLPGTARQYNPPASLLNASAKFVGQVSAALKSRGVRVIDFLEPINHLVSPRPFSVQSEAFFYKALREAVQTSGAEFLDLLDALAPERFGKYEDGTPDPFHIDVEGHAEIAARLIAVLGFD